MKKNNIFFLILLLSLGVVFAGLSKTENLTFNDEMNKSAYESRYEYWKNKYFDLYERYVILEKSYLELKKSNRDDFNIEINNKTYFTKEPKVQIINDSSSNNYFSVIIDYEFISNGKPVITVFEYENIYDLKEKYTFGSNGSIKLGKDSKYKVKPGNAYSYLIYYKNNIIYKGSFKIPYLNKSNMKLKEEYYFQKPIVKIENESVKINYKYTLNERPLITIFEYENIYDKKEKYRFESKGDISLGRNSKYKVKPGNTYSYLIYYKNNILKNGSFKMPKPSIECSTLKEKACINQSPKCSPVYENRPSQVGKGTNRVFTSCKNN